MNYYETPTDKEVVEVYYEARWKDRNRGNDEKKFDSGDYTDPEVQLAAAMAFAATKALELSHGYNVADTETRVEVVEIEVHERRMRIFTKDEVMNLLKPKVEGYSEEDLAQILTPPQEASEPKWVKGVDPAPATATAPDLKASSDDDIPF